MSSNDYEQFDPLDSKAANRLAIIVMTLTFIYFAAHVAAYIVVAK